MGPAERLGALLRARGLTVATAESCTGGLVGAAITAAAGSSDYYLGGVVAYANAAKVRLLGVDPQDVTTFGAVSAEVARAMAEGARFRLGADVAVSVTGIAGPGGGSPGKPVGLVYIGVATAARVTATRLELAGERAAIRAAAVSAALEALADAAEATASRLNA